MQGPSRRLHRFRPPDDVVKIARDVVHDDIQPGVGGLQWDQTAQCGTGADCQRLLPGYVVIKDVVTKLIYRTAGGIQQSSQRLTSNFQVLGFIPNVSLAIEKQSFATCIVKRGSHNACRSASAGAMA